MLEVRFENGEDVELSVAGRTVGIRMKPDQTLFSSKLSSIVLGLAAATEASEMPELISRIKEAAENASDIEEWIENIRSGPRAALVSGWSTPLTWDHEWPGCISGPFALVHYRGLQDLTMSG